MAITRYTEFSDTYRIIPRGWKLNRAFAPVPTLFTADCISRDEIAFPHVYVKVKLPPPVQELL